MKAPELHHRDHIEAFCREEAERLGHAVLLLPVADPLVIPKSMPPGFIRKDREGNRLDPGKLVAYAPEYAFDVAAAHGVSFNGLGGHIGAHLTEVPGDYVVDLMSEYPNQIKGLGAMLIIDGRGWRSENHDLLLTSGARFNTDVAGEVAILGVGIVGREDLANDIRRVTDPAMEHFQESVPIGM